LIHEGNLGGPEDLTASGPKKVHRVLPKTHLGSVRLYGMWGRGEKTASARDIRRRNPIEKR